MHVVVLVGTILYGRSANLVMKSQSYSIWRYMLSPRTIQNAPLRLYASKIHSIIYVRK